MLVSKLRRVLAGQADLTTSPTGYRLELPPAAWIDVLAAEASVQEAESRLTADDPESAISAGKLAESILCETFMPGDEGAWVQAKRGELAAVRTRALDSLGEGSLRSGQADAAVRWAQRAVEVEPFRESGYRRLMAAHVADGNRAEALRVYDHCRRLLAEELGAFPSPETEAMYRELLEEPPQAPKEPPPHASPARPSRRRLGLAVAALLVIGGGVLATLALVERGNSAPAIVPNSLVRVDPKTLRVTEVAPVGADPDFVVPAGRYLWVTNHILREGGGSSPGLVNTGDRTLTRVDPTTGTAMSVSGGLAPCGITPDPSGDVWVANCYPRIPGLRDDVVRVGARTLGFKKIVPAPGGPGYYRGLAYGDGSLWVSQIAGPRPSSSLTQIDPQTGAERTIPLPQAGAPLAWSGSYGNLWIASFDYGSVTRLQPGTWKPRVVPGVASNPASLAVGSNAIWVGDWATPQVVRISAVGSPVLRRIRLPGTDRFDGVWCVAVGAGAVWATKPGATPADAALWRIDPKTGHASRLSIPYRPACVTANAKGVWVTLRP